MRLVSSCSRPPHAGHHARRPGALPSTSTTNLQAQDFPLCRDGRGPGGLQGVRSHPELIGMCRVIVTRGRKAASSGHFPGRIPGVGTGPHLADPLLPCVPCSQSRSHPLRSPTSPARLGLEAERGNPKQLQVGCGRGLARGGALRGWVGPEGLLAQGLSFDL